MCAKWFQFPPVTQCCLAHVLCARLKLSHNCALRKGKFRRARRRLLGCRRLWVNGWWPLGAPTGPKPRAHHVGYATQRAHRVGAAGGASPGQCRPSPLHLAWKLPPAQKNGRQCRGGRGLGWAFVGSHRALEQRGCVRSARINATGVCYSMHVYAKIRDTAYTWARAQHICAFVSQCRLAHVPCPGLKLNHN